MKQSKIQSNNKAVFLSLVRIGIGHHADVLFDNIDWPSIQTLAEKQGLYGIVLDSIEKIPQSFRPNQEFLLEWIGEVLQGYEYRYEQYCKTIAELAGFYNSHGYKMMVLKGHACALNWPKPAHRPCGDIDIWLFGKQKEADSLLAKEKKIKVDKSHHHHTVFNWAEFTVENHYDFVNVHAERSGIEMEMVFKDLGQDDTHFVEMKNESKGTATIVYLPSPNLHALFLIKHNVSHFVGSNITLRQVLDWAFFVEKHTKEIDWNWLNGMIEKYHMKEFVNSLNAICVEELGFDPSIFKGVQFNPHLKDRILADIISPKYPTEEPARLIPRLVFKFKRWEGNGWKQKLCYNETRWSLFWSGLWAKILKPASL